MQVDVVLHIARAFDLPEPDTWSQITLVAFVSKISGFQREKSGLTNGRRIANDAFDCSCGVKR
jgi:hypothetical protein